MNAHSATAAENEILIHHLQTLKCLKCGHVWIPRQPEVRICPSCKTAYWDVKRN